MPLTPRRLTLLAGLGLLLPLLLTTASPSAAATIDRWFLREHTATHPSTGVPALTLEHGWVGVRRGFEDDNIVATVTLAGTPDASTDARLEVGLGQLVDDICVRDWTVTTTSFAPGRDAQRAGSTIELVAPHAPEEQMQAWTCASISLSRIEDPKTVVDRLEGRYKAGIVVDLVSQLKVHPLPKPDRVVPGRWTTVTLRVANQGVTVDRIRVTGKGKPDLEVGKVVVAQRLEGGDVALVRLPIRLNARSGRRLVVNVTGRPVVAAMPRTLPRTIWIRPR